METKAIKRVLILCTVEKREDRSDKAIMFARSFLPDLYPLHVWSAYNTLNGIPTHADATDLLIIMDDYRPPLSHLLDRLAEGMVVIIGQNYDTLTAYQWGKEPETVGIKPGMKRTFEFLKLKPILD